MLKNLSYLALLQLFNYALPILTVPFLVKTLGKDSFGILALSQVVASYLIVICDYGFNISATREVALHAKDKKTLSITVSKVLAAKSVIGFSSLVITTLIIALFLHDNQAIFIVSASQVIGQIFFPVWFFQGIENMPKMVIFFFVSKVIYTILIFLFIRNADDALLASFFFSATNIFSGLLALRYAIRKYHLKLSLPHILDIKASFVTGFDVFIPSFFSNVISNGGVLVLGIFHPPGVVGIYAAIEKLVKAGIGVLSVITQTTFPIYSRIFATSPRKARQFLSKIMYIVLSGLAIVFSIVYFFSSFLLSVIYSPFFRQYDYVLNWLLVWVFVSFMNNFIGIHLLVGSGHGALYRRSFSLAMAFVVLSLPIIALMGINGLLVSVLGVELALTCIMILFIKKQRILND